MWRHDQHSSRPRQPTCYFLFESTPELQSTGQRANKHHTAHAHFPFIPPSWVCFFQSFSCPSWLIPPYNPPTLPALEHHVPGFKSKMHSAHSEWSWMELCTAFILDQTSLPWNLFFFFFLTHREKAVPSFRHVQEQDSSPAVWGTS